MEVRRKAQTQTEGYWRREFKLRSEDIEAISDLMLEDGRPRTLDELVHGVVDRQCQREAQVQKPEQAVMYRPREHYEVGQTVFFPRLGYASGKVTAVRPGQNPRYGSFSVITISLEGTARTRDFAADLQTPHALNDMAEEVTEAAEDELSVDEICRRYGAPVHDALRDALMASPEFTHYDDVWFLPGLLPQVHVGHLNLAEAVVDVAGHPLSTEEILEQVDLGGEAKPQARVFALTLALEKDGRFDNVGTASRPYWFLFNLEPPAVAAKPVRLVVDFPTTGNEWVHRESLEVVSEIGDELDELPGAGQPAKAGKASLVVSYPHRQEGTFPLTRDVLALVPVREYTRVPVQFTDGRSDHRWRGWVLPQDGYGWGLSDWYKREEIPAGATIELAATADPYVLAVQCDTRSRRGEWARVPRVENNRLTFEIRKRAYTCRYDRNLLLGEPTETERLDALRAQYHAEPRSLFQCILLIFPELAKLGSQGLVHAKALYAAMNVMWRVGAVPVFAELARHACFDPVGGASWAFDESLVDVVYQTPEEMEQRPRSKRVDLIRDRVMRYGSPA